MQTTIELPEPIYRQGEQLARLRGVTVGGIDDPRVGAGVAFRSAPFRWAETGESSFGSLQGAGRFGFEGLRSR